MGNLSLLQIFIRKPEGKDNAGDLGVDGREKLTLEQYGECVWLRLTGSGQVPIASFCEYDNKSLYSIKA
jgi:hypothetical protein